MVRTLYWGNATTVNKVERTPFRVLALIAVFSLRQQSDTNHYSLRSLKSKDWTATRLRGKKIWS